MDNTDLRPLYVSSECTRVIERLYGNSHLLNEAGQYAYYGRVTKEPQRRPSGPGAAE